MEDAEKVRTGEPDDVEAHKKPKPQATDEPKAEGESDEDFEAHRKVQPQ